MATACFQMCNLYAEAGNNNGISEEMYTEIHAWEHLCHVLSEINHCVTSRRKCIHSGVCNAEGLRL
jgi:hypothetical protein